MAGKRSLRSRPTRTSRFAIARCSTCPYVGGRALAYRRDTPPSIRQIAGERGGDPFEVGDDETDEEKQGQHLAHCQPPLATNLSSSSAAAISAAARSRACLGGRVSSRGCT